MKSLLDSDRVTLAPRGGMSTTAEDNYRRLSREDAVAHFTMLQTMLTSVREIAGLNAVPYFRGHKELRHFCTTLLAFIQGIIAKKDLEVAKGQSDIGFDCVIDPSASGYPLFIRDLHFLNSAQSKADAELRKLPSDSDMVEDALFSLFRGVMPRDVILKKMEKNFYQLLKDSQSIRKFTFSEPAVHKHGNEFVHVSLGMEYLDELTNVPKLYLFEFRVTKKLAKDEAWMMQVFKTIEDGIGGVARNELKNLAVKIEAVDGVQVDGIQRMDLGPFYNRFTQNDHPLGKLIHDENDCSFQFRLFNIQRMGQERKTGIGNWFRGFASGDWHHGTFSKVIQSPIYAVMYHYMVQRAHIEGLDLDEPIKMFGISSRGVILD